MLADQLIQAATLFGLGMGTVFVLLSVLISCVSLLSLACQKFAPQPKVVQNTGPAAVTTSPVQQVSALETAIVTAAVKAHRDANA